MTTTEEDDIHYVVATIKPWNLEIFRSRAPALRGHWHLVEAQGDLTIEWLQTIRPRYIFFPHWSWKVPDDILTKYECVCFHMTDVPYGRGGSPLQNLIVRGHKNTVVSALRMVRELDAGPVYLKQPLSLEGSAQAIFERATGLIFDMIGEIVASEPQPKQQQGTPTLFERRHPEQSRLPTKATLKVLYDHIRMLDADTYPKAFIEHGDWRVEFSEARLEDGTLTAHVQILADTERQDMQEAKRVPENG